MKIIKWLASGIVLILLLAAAAHYYFLHISIPGAPRLTGVMKSDQLIINQHPRTFDYYLPLKRDVDPALIFVLHGSLSDGDDARAMTGYEFDRLADDYGFIVVYPDGYKKHWNDCRGTANYAANTENIDEITFFQSMIAYFSGHYAVSPARIFAAGFSNGGHMSYRLGYEMPEKIRAIAAIAASLPDAETSDCERRGLPVSVAIFNGTNDPVNPYAGGLVSLFGDSSRGTVISSLATAEYWAGLASIDEAPYVEELADGDGNSKNRISRKSWTAEDGTMIRLYTLEGSGHVVPSRRVRFGRFFGGNAGDIEAAEEIWQFFQAVERAAPQRNN